MRTICRFLGRIIGAVVLHTSYVSVFLYKYPDVFGNGIIVTIIYCVKLYSNMGVFNLDFVI